MSLRAKQALILLVATVLPFLMGGVAVDLVVAPAYRRVVARAAESSAQRVADHLSWNVERTVSRLERLAAHDEVRKAALGTSVDARQARRLDAEWPRIMVPDVRADRLLGNPVARELWWWQQADPAAVELFATNAAGQLVAASQKPSDFIQNDEAWWQQAYSAGRGRIYISDPEWDASARASVLAVAVPIRAGAQPGARVVGILKVLLSVRSLFQEIGRTGTADSGVLALTDGAGKVLASQRPIVNPARGAGIERLRAEPSGWWLARADGDSALVAWAKVGLSPRLDAEAVRSPALYVVGRQNAAVAFGPLRRVQSWMIVISLMTIITATVLGYWLTELLVVRQIRKLAAGMRQLARGDFDRAAGIAAELTANGKQTAAPADAALPEADRSPTG